MTVAHIHIFKPGCHTAMSGASHAFAEADLRAMAQNYDVSKHEAPLVIGHPQHDRPAYGWVQGLSYSDGSGAQAAGLWATPHQVEPALAEMVVRGAYKKISAAFYGPEAPNNPTPGRYYLRHVGFLGAQPPAVKGLRSPAFAQDDRGVLAFEFGEADPAGPAVASDPTTKEPTVSEEEAAQLRADNLAQAARIAQLEAAARQEQAQRIHAAHSAFADALVTEGRLLSQAKDVIVATLDHLAAQERPVEFGEGQAKAALIDRLKATLQTAPKAVEFGEQARRDTAAAAADTDAGADSAFADNGADPQRLLQHRAIVAYMAKHQCDYRTAARATLS